MARHSKHNRLLIQFGAIAITTALVGSGIAVSQSSATIQTIDLGSASSFAVLAGSGITSAGSTNLSGTAGDDIGCSGATCAFTGDETVLTEGTKFLDPNPITAEAKVDLEAAYQDVVSKTPTSLGNFSLSGTLTPGVYNSSSSLGIVDSLTLDAEGNSDAIFIFQAGSTLTTSGGSEVRLINGAQASNVFWQVGTSATFGGSSIFMGRVMSLNSISLAEQVSIQGQLLAVNGAITLSANTIVNDLSAQMPTVLSTAKPSGDALIGSTLSSAVSFGGVPMPAVSYLWQFSQDGLTDWSLIEGEESSTLTLENIHVGGYLRTVVTATNIAGSITETSEKSTQVLPVVPTSLELVPSSTADGIFNQGDAIAIQIGFSESVMVSGIPTLTLETGNIDQVVDYSSGSGTKTLVFVYTVQPGDVSGSLDYLGINSLSLNGGTISDRAGNNAVLTLAEPGSVGSLADSSSFEIDGSVLALELTSSVSTASTSSVSWSLDAKAELDCSTLSKTDGVDFDLDGLISIDSISSSADKDSCIITGTSPVDPAQFGTSSISISSEFSVEDSLGNLQSSASEEDTEILVTVAPESSGSGGITVTDTTGVIADQYELELNQALFSGASSTGLEEILGIGLVDAVEGAPSHSVSVDQTEIIDPESVLNSMSLHHISAGDSISLELEVSEEISQHHSLAAFIKTGDNWSYAGLTDLNNTVAQTNEFTLTEPGTYHFRLFVVEEDFQAVTQTTAMSFANNFIPSFSVMNISEQNLPETNLSHEAQVFVTDSVTTVSPGSPAPTPQPEDDTEQTPPATEEPEPAVPEETTPEETVPEETAPEETEPEETEPVAPEETEPAVPEDEDQLIPEGTNPDSATDTGGQLPDTGMTNWILPAGIGVLIAMLGVLVLISRRLMA